MAKQQKQKKTSTVVPRRRSRRGLWFTYGFMTLAIGIISLVCLFAILGYYVDIKTRTIERGGLLQFRSVPDNAMITLNDTRLAFNTPGRYNAPTGTYRTVISKEGYTDWQKIFTLDAGELRWVNDARLVPKNLQTKAVATPGAVSDSLATPDRKYIATIGEATSPVVTVYDIRGKNTTVPAKSYTIPADQLTIVDGQESRFSLEEWDFGANYLLVKHTVGETEEYIRLKRDSETGEALNLSKSFNMPFRHIHFSGTSGNLLYAVTGTDLRKIDTGAQSVSQPLVTGIDKYQLYKETDIAFTATREGKYIAGVYQNGKETIVRSYDTSLAVLTDITKYFSDYYLVVVRGQSFEIIKNPAEAKTGQSAKSIRVLNATMPLEWINFASSGRHLIVGSGTSFMSYDLETSEHFSVAQTGQTATPAERPLRWIDDFYLASTTTGTLQIGEYDGTNRHDIVKVQPNSRASLSEDGTYIYSIGSEGGKATLQRTLMILQ